MNTHSKNILACRHVRGFTLIELLVVISIIGMLSSVVIAALGGTKAKARDAVRAAEVNQLNTAVQLYTAAVGNVPLLQKTGSTLNCDATQTTLDASNVSNCIANSNAPAGTPEAVAWTNLQDNLSEYFPNIAKVTDPCGSGASCVTSSGTVLGYTYVAPAAMQYVCDPTNGVMPANSNCPPSTELDKYNQLYQMYAPNEGNSGAVGTTPVGTYYAPPPATNQILCPTGQSYNGSSCVESSTNTPPPPPPPAPTIAITSVSPSSVAQGNNLNISWNAENAPDGSAVVLLLYNNSGKPAGRIREDLTVQGTYSWKFPGSACAIGVNGFGFCSAPADTPYVRATEPGTYSVVAKLYTPKGGLGNGRTVSASSPNPLITFLATSPDAAFSITGPTVTISAISPSSGPVGTVITITGSASSGTFISAVSKILFGQSQFGQITPTLVSNSQVSFVVPGGISGQNGSSVFYSPVSPGSYTVKVSTSGGGNISNGLPFTVTSQPCNAPPGQLCL